MFHPFEVSIPHITYACLGGFIVLFGMFSLFLREKLYIGEACWAFLFGVIIGPYGAGIFNPRAWGGGDEEVTNMITLEFTRVVLAIGVFAIGVELPKAYMARHWKSIFFLLVPVMTWGWFVSAGLIFAFIPGLNFLSSLAVAACLTPTDPILAAAVVGGKWADKHVPAHLRHLLAAESGCNDGAAFPFLFIALYLLLDAPDTGGAIRDWFLLLWLYQVILGIIIGAFIGFGFRHLMKFCQRLDLIDRHSYVAQYVSLALFTIGVTTLLGSDDLLAAFACGTAFAWDGFFNRQTEESVFSSVIDLLFNVAAFIFVGAWMPFSSFQNEDLGLSVWRLIVIAILVLILRRLPVMIALYKWIPDVKTFREAIFSGHFGPIGIGAIFISTLASEVIHKDKHQHSHQVELLNDTIQPIVAFMVLCSITIHGLSIPSFSLGRRVRTVSRTWSRHAPPDWTNQARLVSRGAADIVINRDDEMERGHLEATEKTLGTESLSSQGRRTPEEKQPDDDGSLDTKLNSGIPHDFQARPDTPPDGDEQVAEWQEPHHRVIERRRGAGEDVDVEVTNEEDPEGHGLVDQIRQSLTKLDGLKQTAHALEHEAADGIEGEVKEIEGHVQQIEESVKALSTSAQPGKAGPSTTIIESSDEGWTSDRSYPDPTLAGGDQKKRSKATRPKITTVGSGRRGRTRTSLRRGLAQHPSLHHDDADAHATRVDERGRVGVSSAGSTSTHPADTPSPETPSFPYASSSRTRPISSSSHHRSRPNTAESSARPTSSGSQRSRPDTAESSIRHHRLDHIRALHTSPPTREVSPSRSVRFMDEAPPDTPRAPLDSAEEPDSARGKVTFDVPKITGGKT
ncbi:Sodium/hydrogen exchanger family-domain-containing protein [Collybia nuda]|uniref:Sodium/hydrogen exchanger family-domain-containing protein n=1 Tax=Collybia nuda TaxID=64659 RepID=A0A9P6CKI5_9AGAR|nr:Sodium/hydrogen exchanger family-domain-containing protein [Collybia nuda]